jgi:hypothetical protein
MGASCKNVSIVLVLSILVLFSLLFSISEDFQALVLHLTSNRPGLIHTVNFQNTVSWKVQDLREFFQTKNKMARPPSDLETDAQLYDIVHRDDDMVRYQIHMSYKDFLVLLASDDAESVLNKRCRHLLNNAILGSFQGLSMDYSTPVFFETAPVNKHTWSTENTFQFVVLRDRGHVLIPGPVVIKDLPFNEHFDRALINSGETLDKQDSIVFDNLSGDATLISPLPESFVNSEITVTNYTHIKSFLFDNLIAKQHPHRIITFWKRVAEATLNKIGNCPHNHKYWLSTHGGGVPYLHVRIDKRPKYYHYAEFKT